MPRYLPSGMPGGHAVCLAEGCRHRLSVKSTSATAPGKGTCRLLLFRRQPFWCTAGKGFRQPFRGGHGAGISCAVKERTLFSSGSPPPSVSPVLCPCLPRCALSAVRLSGWLFSITQKLRGISPHAAGMGRSGCLLFRRRPAWAGRSRNGLAGNDLEPQGRNARPSLRPSLCCRMLCRDNRLFRHAIQIVPG